MVALAKDTQLTTTKVLCIWKAGDLSWEDTTDNVTICETDEWMNTLKRITGIYFFIFHWIYFRHRSIFY